jgi:dihydroorotate dehydrogenase electron transfer subunit
VSHPLAAAYYADSASHETVGVVENVEVARDTFRMRLACPEIARRVLPGQFFMVRLADGDDPLLGRALALYDTVLDDRGNPVTIDVVYLVVGKATRRLTRMLAGDTLRIWGPLGNGFSSAAPEHLVVAAGGIGITPFPALVRQFLGKSYGPPARQVSMTKTIALCYGVRTAEYLVGVEEFRSLGVDVRISTDDGSLGQRGFVTNTLRKVLAEKNGDVRVAACGPEPMLEAVADLTRDLGVPCEVSLETPMACGIGICFSCVTRVRQPGGDWDYKRTCVDGPVFDAAKLEW